MFKRERRVLRPFKLGLTIRVNSDLKKIKNVNFVELNNGRHDPLMAISIFMFF